jgi:aspartyl-tRNA(Asn)/glutamyl-tRNA(Gln) amidotransferase subunit C
MELFARQLEEILTWAESLQALDTSGVPPMSHPQRTSALREDEPRAGLDRESALGAAPDAGDGLFRVPRVLGG